MSMTTNAMKSSTTTTATTITTKKGTALRSNIAQVESKVRRCTSAPVMQSGFTTVHEVDQGWARGRTWEPKVASVHTSEAGRGVVGELAWIWNLLRSRIITGGGREY